MCHTRSRLRVVSGGYQMSESGEPVREPLPIRFEEEALVPVIKVVGIGGAGGNAINRMIAGKVQSVQFITINTDLQDLRANRSPEKLQIGAKLTKGLGCGSNPDKGRQAALEDTDKIMEALEGADMVFVTAGLGGGTGTGAAPIVASLATEMGALTVAVVTKPFVFEGRIRIMQAERGLRELHECVDTVLAIPNERLLHTVDKKTSLLDAFVLADDVLRQGVQGISDLITIPGVINLDFADVKETMSGMGMALMGTGIAEGEQRAAEAAQRAISSPLLEESSIEGARGVLINITGGPDVTLHEVNTAAHTIYEAADDDAHIIFGSVIDPEMKGKLKLTVIATGFEGERRARAGGELDNVASLAARQAALEAAQASHSSSAAPAGGSNSFYRGAEASESVPEEFANNSFGGRDSDELEELDSPAYMRRKVMD